MRMGQVNGKILRDRDELPPRQVEENFARRVAYEMDRRGWSQERLAREMTRAGCPMHQSAISKIVRPRKGTTRRSITLEEAVAFSRVFQLALDEMFDSVLLARTDEVRLLLIHQNMLFEQLQKTWRESRETVPRLAELMSDEETAAAFFDWLDSLPETQKEGFEKLLQVSSVEFLALAQDIFATQTARATAIAENFEGTEDGSGH